MEIVSYNQRVIICIFCTLRVNFPDKMHKKELIILTFDFIIFTTIPLILICSFCMEGMLNSILNVGMVRYKSMRNPQYKMFFFFPFLSLSSSGCVCAEHRRPGAGLQVSPEQQGWYIYPADSQYG